MRCEQHGMMMTAQRGGDPVCVECYLDALRQVRTPRLPDVGWRHYHGKVVWIIGGKEITHGKA